MLLNLFLSIIRSFKISCSTSKSGTFSLRCHEPLHRLAAFRHWLSKLNTVKILEDSHTFVIWKVQSNIYKRDIWKFVVKLWSSSFFVRLWAICGERLHFQHMSAVCFRRNSRSLRSLVDTVTEEFDISVSAELCGLYPQDLYVWIF